ncbi:MAG: type I-C CRISPR-associated protein Cas5c [Clostridiaceae bacterium]|jgi:CRISPR-associated protein Cas5d|nr:type I-C CRISPR-associated protein Cas5c [Clostridiaceae bacterium]
MNNNTIEFQVSGKYALFTDPITRMGGMKSTYLIPTYQGLVGIADACYWKPTFRWRIIEVRVMNKIQMQTKATIGVKYKVEKGGSAWERVEYTYLKDVEYQVRAAFEWDMTHDELAEDRNEMKHREIALRSVNKGGRRAIVLGTSECGAFIEPCKFGDGQGAYDDIDLIEFGLMFHGFDYPTVETEKLKARFWRSRMHNGIIEFPAPNQCAPELVREIKDYSAKKIYSSPERAEYEREELL